TSGRAPAPARREPEYSGSKTSRYPAPPTRRAAPTRASRDLVRILAVALVEPAREPLVRVVVALPLEDEVRLRIGPSHLRGRRVALVGQVVGAAAAEGGLDEVLGHLGRVLLVARSEAHVAHLDDGEAVLRGRVGERRLVVLPHEAD